MTYNVFGGTLNLTQLIKPLALTQPSTSLVDRLVDDMLLQTTPCINHAPHQINNFDYRRAVGWHGGLVTLSVGHRTCNL